MASTMAQMSTAQWWQVHPSRLAWCVGGGHGGRLVFCCFPGVSRALCLACQHSLIASHSLLIQQPHMQETPSSSNCTAFTLTDAVAQTDLASLCKVGAVVFSEHRTALGHICCAVAANS